MKKSSFIIALAFLSFSTYSQVILKAGLTAATTKSETPNESDFKEQFKAGFLVGAGYQLALGNFAIQPELLFVQKGSTVKNSLVDPPFSISETLKITLNYLELPVMFKYMFGPENLRISLNAGPSLSVGLNGKGTYEGTLDLGNGPNNDSYNFKVKFEEEPEGYEGNDLFIKNKTDIGLQLGGGLVIASKIMVDLRYGVGFSDWGNEVTTKNRALQLSVGILLGN